MKAAVFAGPGMPLTIEEIDKPQIADDEMLVKVARCGICGTDIQIYQWDEWAQNAITVPLTAGHEFSGQIVEPQGGAQQ